MRTFSNSTPLGGRSCARATGAERQPRTRTAFNRLLRMRCIGTSLGDGIEYGGGGDGTLKRERLDLVRAEELARVRACGLTVEALAGVEDNRKELRARPDVGRDTGVDERQERV